VTALSLSCCPSLLHSRNTMKYELLAAAVFLLVGAASEQEFGQGDTVVAVDPDTELAEGEDVVHYWGVTETDDYINEGTGDIVMEFDDTWEAGEPYGKPWDPEAESTREGSDLGGNPNPDDQDFVIPQLGDELVTGPVMEIFEGRDVKESLATEHGRGGGARGHARGRGRAGNNRRNLRAKKQH